MRKIYLSILTMLFVSGALFAQDFSSPDSWFTYDDKEAPNNGSSSISMKSAKEGDALAVSVTGSVTKKFQYGFAGFGVNPSKTELERLKVAKGIKFKVIGDGRAYRVRVEISNVKDYNHYGKVFITKPGQVVEVIVPYASLEQEPWGTKLVFKKGNIQKISFQTTEQPISKFELKIISMEIMP